MILIFVLVMVLVLVNGFSLDNNINFVSGTGFVSATVVSLSIFVGNDTCLLIILEMVVGLLPILLVALM